MESSSLVIARVICCLTIVASAAVADSDRDSVVRGQVLFSKRGCRNCHAIDPAVQTIGPALGNVSEKLSLEKTVESIVHPSKEIRKGFESVVVVTVEGKIYTGRLTLDEHDGISLMSSRDGSVETQKIARDDIDDVVKMQTSVMPTDLLKGLSTQDVRDLLSYLTSIGLTDPASEVSDVLLEKLLQRTHEHHGHTAVPSYESEPDTRLKFDTVDHEVSIDVVPKQMRYGVELFDVKPGARVKLTLHNEDEMQHNLFVCAEGTTSWLDVAKAAWALGSDGLAKRYTPESDAILHHTRLVDPGSSDSIYFVAPEKEGVYPYVCTLPGHAFLMRGEMHVMSETRGLSNVHWRYFEGDWDRLPDFESLKPLRSGMLAANELPSLESVGQHSGDRFGIVFDGSLKVILKGRYTFYLDTDDGSRLLIDGKTVVEYDGVHPDGTPRSNSVDLEAGMHDLQLQYFEKGGGEVLLAGWSGPGFRLLPLTGGNKTIKTFQESDDYLLKTDDQPQVVRVHMPDSSPRSIAVGLIGGVNACFDAHSCYVRYGWTGAFLDVGPDRGYGRSRGGGRARILGQRFGISGDEFPIRIGSEPAPAAEFMGYRRALSGPTFEFRLGGIRVSQTIETTQSSRGLQMTFRLDPAPQFDLTYTVAESGLQLTSSAGTWNDTILTIPAADGQEFTISMEPAP